MIYKKIILVIISLFLSVNFCFAISSDTALSSKVDSASINKNIDKDSGFELIAIGGIGMTTGSLFGEWNNDFRNGPAFSAGIELPFTDSHIFALELYEHYWISKLESRQETINYSRYFIKLSENYYSQSGLSAVVKYYIGDKKSRFRWSLHLGIMWFSTNKNYSGMDMGLGIYYNISEKLSLYLSRRIIWGHENPLGGGYEMTPNFLMLNICYHIKLENK
jgi:hypothetical protein